LRGIQHPSLLGWFFYYIRNKNFNKEHLHIDINDSNI
jgi:hypothetical protein